MKSKAIRLICIALLALGLSQMAQGSWIHLKAALAQLLLEKAWQRSLQTGRANKPWSWADTWPLARLEVPRLGEDIIVLAGDHGQALAFGPGHASLSAKPGEPGTMLISGHRDTHFRFLKDLQAGDLIRIGGAAGIEYEYRVTSTEVVDSTKTRVISDPNQHRLILATCWPLDAVIPGGNQRYLVISGSEQGPTS